MAPTTEERMVALERRIAALTLRMIQEAAPPAARSRGGRTPPVDPRLAALEQRVEKLVREVDDLAFELRSAAR